MKQHDRINCKLVAMKAGEAEPTDLEKEAKKKELEEAKKKELVLLCDGIRSQLKEAGEINESFLKAYFRTILEAFKSWLVVLGAEEKSAELVAISSSFSSLEDLGSQHDETASTFKPTKEIVYFLCTGILAACGMNGRGHRPENGRHDTVTGPLNFMAQSLGDGVQARGNGSHSGSE